MVACRTLLAAAAAALATACPSGPKPQKPAARSGCPVETLPRPTSVIARGELARSFGRNRVAMHAYLYNGDDLWPKKANLCARGRNAILDLEAGPGASFDLGLFGAAWKAHVHAVACSNQFENSAGPLTGTRFLAAWPVVTDGMTRWLVDAHRFQMLAAALQRSSGSTAQWTRMARLARRLEFRKFLLYWKLACRPVRGRTASNPAAPPTTCGPRPSVPAALPAPGRPWSMPLLKLAQMWGRNLAGALLNRLSFSAATLKVSVDRIDLTSEAGRQTLTARILRPAARAHTLLKRYSAQIIKGATRAGVFFPFQTYDAFRRKHLLACVPPYGCGLSVFQLEAIEQQLAGRLRRRTDRQTAKVLKNVRGELKRLRFILKGEGKWAHGAPPAPLVEKRKRYLETSAQMEKDRVRLGTVARTWFQSEGLKALSTRLSRPGHLVAASSFYFETEHLNEALSGFTHVAVVQRLGRIKKEPEGPWQLDRVLGFHYVYPIRLLKNSIPVELVHLDRRTMDRRRLYAWVKFQVPRIFRFASGKSSPVVSLINIFFHLKALLKQCPHLRVTPGFYYAGATWMLNHPHNKPLLRTCWRRGTHMGFSYRSLDRNALQRLKGKVLMVPVEYLPATLRRPGR